LPGLVSKTVTKINYDEPVVSAAHLVLPVVIAHGPDHHPPPTQFFAGNIGFAGGPQHIECEVEEGAGGGQRQGAEDGGVGV
jgi:hypothetical protein